MQIRWSKPATANFNAIFAYIAIDSESAARTQARRILASIRQLENFPNSGRLLSTGTTRVLVVPRTPCVVHYRVRKDHIRLMAIVHGARNKPDRT